MASTAELLELIFRSEPDYAEISERLAALTALGAGLTAEQTAEMAHYTAQVAHDEALVAAWRAQLPLAVRTNLNGATARSIRTAHLQAMADDEQADADAAQAIADAYANGTADVTVTPSHALAMRAHWLDRRAARLARRARRLALRSAAINAWGFA